MRGVRAHERRQQSDVSHFLKTPHGRPLAEKRAAPVGLNALEDAILLAIVGFNAIIKPSTTAAEAYDCIDILRIPGGAKEGYRSYPTTRLQTPSGAQL